MANLKGGFMSFLISGFGTGMSALRALGITLAIFLFGFWLVWKIVKMIYVAIRGPQVPNFKCGHYQLVLTSVGPNPKELKKELLQYKGYTSAWANRLLNGKEKVVARGLDVQAADDFKAIVEHYGATAEIEQEPKK